jgi:molybdopterin-containing oxidoreductase family iron-sulfur binding subunit
MEDKKTAQYWKGLDELHHEPSFEKQRHNEFAEKLPLSNIVKEDELGFNSSRRDFLKFMGFGITAATLAACHKTPIRKAVPYVFKPDEMEPGIADYYATTCHGCQARCSLLVKTREGRPIKIEGNDASPLNMGGVCAVGQGTVLSLYDQGRLAKPQSKGQDIKWDDLDRNVISQLKNIAASGAGIRILTGTITSPSTLNAIKEFTAKYPNTQHVMYDAVSSSSLRTLHGGVVPNYRFDKAKVVVSFGADFLGAWISPVEYMKGYAAARRQEENNGQMLHHVQFESTLSLTGSNADIRAVLLPSQYGQALTDLYNAVNGGSVKNELMGNSISHAAKMLQKYRGAGIVVTDSNDPDHQAIVAAINTALGNYGNTIDLSTPSYQRQGDDVAVINLVNDMNAGKIGALFIYDTNPSYTYPDQAKFNAGLKKVGLTVSLSDRKDETAANCQHIAPVNHFLESWDDDMPKEGFMSLSQPTISPIFDTRTLQESLSIWMEAPMEGGEYVKHYWQTNVFPKAGSGDFETFWKQSLEKGFVTVAPSRAGTAPSGNAADAMSRAGRKNSSNALEVILYEKVAIRDGKMANNPWLQELPDPVTKVSWDNYAAVSPKWAEEKNLTDEDVVEVKANGYSVKLPILRQPGQRYGTVAIAFGYGHNLDKEAGKVMMEVGGANAYPFTQITPTGFIYQGATVEVSGTGDTYDLALTQTHHHMEGRDIVMETTTDKVKDYNAKSALKINQGPEGAAHIVSLWKDYRYPGHHWGMAIDLNACTGCNACVVACSAENNVPVVGKLEVRRRREMHWLRIDRYYALSEKKDETAFHTRYKEIDALDEQNNLDYENVKVVFQPMLCQHCNNAPCETVCPVDATNHSSEGLNQQAYNRCVGTRYCANNCPYKVRRFNWFNYFNNPDRFDYHMANDLGRMVLNPDVVVRMRGVMEKCSMCVQRIQLGKLDAKKDGRAVKDGDIKMACQQTCPANAIVFGDMNDPNSQISKLLENKRNYSVLTELGVRPNISYLAKVRSTENA